MLIAVAALVVGVIALVRVNSTPEPPASASSVPVESRDKGLGMAGGSGMDHDPAVSDTLSAVAARGMLNCGTTERAGFGVLSPDGTWSGFDVDICRAVAAGEKLTHCCCCIVGLMSMLSGGSMLFISQLHCLTPVSAR